LAAQLEKEAAYKETKEIKKKKEGEGLKEEKSPRESTTPSPRLTA